MTAPFAGAGRPPSPRLAGRQQEQPAATGPTAVPKMQKTVITAGEADYLRTQAFNILQNGGSEEDVAKFLELEGHRLPPRIQPTRDIEAPSLTRGLAMNALQGITFGFGDEAMGALLGLLTGEGARGGIETYRKELEAFAKARPGVSLPTQVVGGLLTGATVFRGIATVGKVVAGQVARRVGGRATATVARTALGLTPAAPGLIAGAARGAATAGAAGTIAGAGFADIPLRPEDPLSAVAKEVIFGTAVSAAGGAALGAATGGTLVPAGQIAAVVGRPIVRRVTNWSKAIQARLPGIGTSEMHARELAARALSEDGVNLQEALRRLASLERAAGTTVTVADLGGEAILALGRSAASQRSPTAQRLVEALTIRQGEQATRLSAGLVGRIFRDGKRGLGNSYATEEALIAAREAASTPLYTQAHQAVANVTARMRRLLGNKTFREAYRRGRNIADGEDLAEIANPGALRVPKLPAKVRIAGMGEATPAIEAALKAQGIQTFPSELPVRALDYMKRGLDEIINKGFKSGGMSSQRARTLRAALNEVLEEVDTQVPVFGEARAIYRGFSESRSAVILGRDFLKRAPEIVKREVQRLRPQDRDFYRIGAAQSLYETVIRPNAETPNVARQFFGGSLFGRPNINSQRLRALFVDAPEVADDFMRQVAAETRLSHTATRTLGAAPGLGVQKAEQALEGSLPTVRASIGVTALNVARTGILRAQTGWSRDVSDNLADIFTRGLTNPNDIRAVLQSIFAEGERIASRTAGKRVTIELGKLAGRF